MASWLVQQLQKFSVVNEIAFSGISSEENNLRRYPVQN